MSSTTKLTTSSSVPPVLLRTIKKRASTTTDATEQPRAVHRAAGKMNHKGAQRTAHDRRSIKLGPAAVRVTALVEDVDDGLFFYELRFETVSGKPKRKLIARSEIASLSGVRKMLLDHGVVNVEQIDEIIGSLDWGREVPNGRITRRTGWHGQAFVLPHVTLGPDADIRFAPGGTQLGGRGLQRGSLDGWREGVREGLYASSWLTFATALAFAPPLASLTKRVKEPFGPAVEETAAFHFFGQSGAGKTLASKVAASTMGRAQETDLASFNSTRIGTQDAFADHDGTLLALNEMRVANTRPEDFKTLLIDLADVLTSGAGRKRGNAAKNKDPDLRQRNFSIFALTNMEHGLGELSRKMKLPRDPGERARFIDIPVPASESGGIFDRIRKADRKGHLQDVTRGLADGLEATIRENFGVAMRRFIEFVAQRRDMVLRTFQRAVDRFVAKVAPSDAWERRFARKFGFVYAAGLIALLAGALPISRVHLTKAVCKIYRAARATFVSPSDAARTVIQRLMGLTEDDAAFPRIEAGAPAPTSFDQAWGFRRKDSRFGQTICLRRDRLLLEAGSEEAVRELIAELKRLGALMMGPGGDEITQARQVAGHGRRRYIVLIVAALRPTPSAAN